LNIIHYINEFFGFTVALIIGLYTFRHMNFFYRIFFYQLIVFVISFILTYVVLFYEKSNNLPHTDQWIYNLFMPIETGFLAWAGYEYFRPNKERILVWVGYFIFLFILISEIVIKGPLMFSNHGYIAEGILLVVLYLSIIYNQLTYHGNEWKRSPELWISIGITLYFGGIIPYLSLIHYLQDRHPKINLFLYYCIVEGLSHLRYIFLAIGFWLIRRNALAKTIITNE
jgi:hypothetical protein